MRCDGFRRQSVPIRERTAGEYGHTHKVSPEQLAVAQPSCWVLLFQAICVKWPVALLKPGGAQEQFYLESLLCLPMAPELPMTDRRTSVDRRFACNSPTSRCLPVRGSKIARRFI